MSKQSSINFGQDLQHLADQSLRAKRPQQFSMDYGLFGDGQFDEAGRYLGKDLVDIAEGRK